MPPYGSKHTVTSTSGSSQLLLNKYTIINRQRLPIIICSWSQNNWVFRKLQFSLY